MDAILKCIKMEPLNRKALEYQRFLESEKQQLKLRDHSSNAPNSSELSKRLPQGDSKSNGLNDPRKPKKLNKEKK